ncbi:MAG TPA: hypothetical protein DDZ21_06710, partial [Gammaproteobacteria bacterium]|nr:hypothetical protein [Gammaproteobacteria bacterium]
EVSPFYDPMLAKMIAYADTREEALADLQLSLSETSIYGIETNIDYLQTLLGSEPLRTGKYFTNTLSQLEFEKHALEVVTPGTMT